METKDEIRVRMRALRRELTAKERDSASDEICAAVLDRPDVREAIEKRRPFSVYLASSDEIDLTPLIEALWAADVTVAVPCWNAEEKVYVLGAYDNTTTLVEGRCHIPEPAEVNPVAEQDIGVWIVPGLAFTRGGGRIGYGGGWYDRMLRKSSPESLKLGVAHSFQFVDVIPLELHDQSLTAVVSA